MHVLEHNEEWFLLGHAREPIQQHRKGLLLALLRAELRNRIAIGHRQHQQMPYESHRLRIGKAGLAQEAFEFGQPFRRRLVRHESERALEQGYDGE